VSGGKQNEKGLTLGFCLCLAPIPISYPGKLPSLTITSIAPNITLCIQDKKPIATFFAVLLYSNGMKHTTNASSVMLYVNHTPESLCGPVQKQPPNP
jgi:hypothetical protein